MFKKLFLWLTLAFGFNFSSAYTQSVAMVYFEPLDCIVALPNHLRDEKDIRTIADIMVYAMHTRYIENGDEGLEDFEGVCRDINVRLYQFDEKDDKGRNFDMFMYKKYLEKNQKDYFTLDLAEGIYQDFLVPLFN